jgi:membrane fusion protein, multidrug efflux system
VSKTLKWSLAVAGLIVLLILLLPRLQSDGEEAQAAVDRGPMVGRTLVVEVAPLTPVLLRDRSVTTGTLQPNESVELRSEASGRLVEISFSEGDPVRAGDLLARINDDDLQARLRQVQARRELVEQREFRQRRLLEEGGVSREIYEATVGELDVLQADMDVLRAEIRRTEVRAPFDGVVGFRMVSPGSYLTPDRVITTLQDMDPLRLEFSLPIRYAGRTTRGSRVSFTVEGTDEVYEATIYAIDPALEEDTRTLGVRASVPNPRGRLLPGAFARVEVILEEIPDALAVPSIAVRPSLEGPLVYVYRDGRAHAIPVELGLRTRDEVQIVSGLAVGDRVILTGFQQLRDGMEVQAVERDAP